MSQEARRARRAGRVVLQLYKDQAPYAVNVATRLEVTCKEGCSHCCMLPATTTVPEMVLVVEYLINRGDWSTCKPALERELTRQLEAFAAVDVLDLEARRAFFRRQLPCAFLKEQRCEIYPVRPAVCRYHMVTSSPENCSPAAPAQVVSLVDLNRLESAIAIAGAAALGELLGGPLALAFVLAADQLGVQLAVDRSLLDRVTIYRIPVSP